MPNTTSQKLTVSVREVREITGLGETTIWKLIREGNLRVVRVGRRTLVPMSEIDALIDGRLEVQ